MPSHDARGEVPGVRHQSRQSRMNRSHIFLKCYEETGSITKAAEAAQIDRAMHYRRLKKDPKYKAAFEASHEIAVEGLEEEAHRRAVLGIEEPVFWQGMLCKHKDSKTGRIVTTTVRKYSDSLLQFLLRGAKPQRYRERFQADVTANINVTKFKGSLEELLATYRNLTTQEDDPETA